MITVCLAYEFFDDIAAYWFILTILGFIVVPRTIYIVLSWLWSVLVNTLFTKVSVTKSSSTVVRDENGEILHSEDDENCQCKLCVRKSQQIQKYRSAKRWKKWTSFWSILWLCAVVLFVYMLTDYANHSQQQLSSFDPYELLGLDVNDSPSMAAIKKAYRKQSLIYHPDKNPDSEEAHRKFILVSKAYQTLTNEDTRKNYEEFGNPDGFQGTSVTIGLPSFLSRQENHRFVLGVYVLFIVAIPVVVGVWWNKASRMHPSGVLWDTWVTFYRSINENFNYRLLLEVLSSSGEFSEMFKGRDHTSMSRADALGIEEISKELTATLSLRKPFYETLRVRAAFSVKTNCLLHAYMLNVDVPDGLQADLRLVLQKIHMLIEAGVQATATPKQISRTAQKFTMGPVYRLIELSQCVTQRVDFRVADMRGAGLLQLPNISEKSIRRSKMKPKPSIEAFVMANAESDKDKRILLKDLTEEEIQETERVARLIPHVKVDYEFCVEGETDQDVYELDVVTMRIMLSRHLLKPHDSDGDGATDENVDEHVGEDRRKPEDNPLELEWHEEGKVKRSDDLAPLVHAPHFPFPKREVWHLMLWDKKDEVLLCREVITNLRTIDQREVKFMIPENSARTRQYELRCMSDSYLGIDQLVNIDLKVGEKRPGMNSLDDEDDDENREGDDEEEEEPDLKWYYLYTESFGEMVLSLVVLALFGVFMFNFLYTRGWFVTFGGWWQRRGAPLWKRYAQPLLSKLLDYMPEIDWTRWSWLFERTSDVAQRSQDL